MALNEFDPMSARNDALNNVISTNKALSRRELLRLAAQGAAGLTVVGLAGGGLLAPRAAKAAVGGGHGGNLGAVTAQLTGTGLYIDHEFTTWSTATRAANLAQIRGWGFDFICPKVGSDGSTWYSSDSQLIGWRNQAYDAGLGIVPFIYSIPSTYVRDAQICSEIGNDFGIVAVDMEDEWAGYNSTMSAFGSKFRSYNPNTPILVTGYGDPTAQFGTNGWPFAQMAYWADAYIPQWYYGNGQYPIYHTQGVKAAINWGDAQCGQVFGSNFPLCPSFWVYSEYTSNHVLPLTDITTGENYAKNWQAPIFWWEYAYMNSQIAAACVA